MKKWEYTMTYYSRHVNESALNVMGNDGWELISVLKSPEDDGTYRWVFKREKVEPIKEFDVD